MMKKRQGYLEYNSAYTLIEVMLVLAIVSVVLIVALRPLYLNFIESRFWNSGKQCCGVILNVSF